MHGETARKENKLLTKEAINYLLAHGHRHDHDYRRASVAVEADFQYVPVFHVDLLQVASPEEEMWTQPLVE